MNPTPTEEMPLFQRWPALADALPRLAIGCWPTPIMHGRSFGKAHGLDALYIKLENQSHPIAGGNKVRGLEFILGHALSKGARTLVTLGAAGSYHVCRTAFHAHSNGMRVVAVMVSQPIAQYVRRNLALGHELGVDFLPASFVTAGPLMLKAMLTPSNWHNSRPPYYIPPGGSSSRACVGHVNAALELKSQIDVGIIPEPDYLYVAMGSLGTAAGLLLGCRLAGLKARIVGVVVSYPWYCTAGRCARTAGRTLRFLRRYDSSIPEMEFAASDVDVVSTSLGEGYAKFTEESMMLAREAYDLEGLALDGTYTAKTLHGAMQFISRNRCESRTHVFWNSYQPTSELKDELNRKVHPSLRHYFDEATQPLDVVLQPNSSHHLNV